MISIIVPCYNAAKSLNRSVESLLDQSVDVYQIVLVDDGSSDGTSQLCDRYAEMYARVKVVHQRNRGLMGAWKRGVQEADGDYIAFCDADDYIESDFIERIGSVTAEYDADLIVFGLVSEYTNGDCVRTLNLLPEGYYTYYDIRNRLFPELLSNGDMQSELITKSRWSKVFRKDILVSIMSYLNERISLGEDALTAFAAMQVVKSIYCMGNYCPYHYVRTPESMIGGFDRQIFDKISLLYQEMDRIAHEFLYPFPDQILFDRLSVSLVYVKKYICRSTDGYNKTIGAIRGLRESASMRDCIERCTVKGYGIGSKIFAGLFFARLYVPLYYFSRVFERVRGRDV